MVVSLFRISGFRGLLEGAGDLVSRLQVEL